MNHHERLLKLFIKILVAVVIEIAYAVLTRGWLRSQLAGVELELVITVFRLVTAGAYWLLFRDLILGRYRSPGAMRHPLIITGVIVMLLIPFLFQGWDPGGGPFVSLVFALTSIIVGLREEMLYRAVLFNLLEHRIGTFRTLLVSTALFVVYHYGALPFTPLILTEIVCLSLILGLIYLKTGSLFIVIVLHSGYDAIWFFGPYIDMPLPDNYRPAFLVPALFLVFLGTWRFGINKESI